MSDIQCNYATTNNEKADRVSEDQTDDACLRDKQLDIVNNRSRSPDIGILKEQNFFVENNGLISLSKLYSNKNYAQNGGYISGKKEKHVKNLSDIRKVWDELTDTNQNEEKRGLGNVKLNIAETNNENNKNISVKENKPKDVDSSELNKSSPKDDTVGSGLPETNDVYYAVHIPSDFNLSDNTDIKKENLHVYLDKQELLQVVKMNKKARFKQFKSREEAEQFSLNGSEIVSQDDSSIMADNEKTMPFKRPKTEEMLEFRKDIKRGNIEVVREKILKNPKYLVSNGDTPAILQEGSRYNALHVAAIAKNAEITRLILDSITRLDFIAYMYDDNDVDSCYARGKILLDRYLNTPDKGANDTPLHMAAKYGAVEVVQVLLSYAECQKNNAFNKFKELPKDIICSRVREPCEEAKAAIASMMEEQYFVPVLRSEDNSMQPKVGEAFSFNNPLKLQNDLLSPRMEIRAYAGPMSKEKADLLKKKWKMPTRVVRCTDSPLALRLRDTEKGLEKTGRCLASELDVPWQEYWSFLDTFIDISSEAGLNLLETYMKTRFQESLVEAHQNESGNSSGDSSKELPCSIRDLCEAFEMCASQDRQSPNGSSQFSTSTPRSKKTTAGSASSPRDHSAKKSFFSLTSCGKNPVLYVERSCEVFGKRIGAAITSCVTFENHSESLKESLETQIKHLQTLIKSYKEDIRFQSVDFQLVHSRVASVAIQSLQSLTDKGKQSILIALKGIDWSDGALSDDEDIYRNHEWLGVTMKHLSCLVMHLIMQLHDYQDNDLIKMSPSVWSEADCLILWAQATPCKCIWTKNGPKRSRGGLKRKSFRNEFEYEATRRKIQFDDEEEEFVDTLTSVADENEDHFFTPPSGNSDSEEDAMEEVVETPNTFIFPGPLPSKMDYAVLEAIHKVPLSPEKYPNIYLWRHILQMQPKNVVADQQHVSMSEPLKRRSFGFDSPKSSPC
ncbi:hypothetical protein RUM44_007781 [Polyplax serrata]|uniref:ANKLE2 third alpha/beta domain-containing protein n=1 Tax=Polyplax serrata TaxID=468196 RepID=A0ABR1B8H8_POLSC